MTSHSTSQRMKFVPLIAAAMTVGLAMGVPAPAAAQADTQSQMATDLLMLDIYPRDPSNPYAAPSVDAQRNTSIAFLSANTRESVQALQARDNQGVVDAMNYYIYLMLRGVSAQTIKNMTVDDMRNTTITIVSQRRYQPIWQLQSWNANTILQADKFPFAYFEYLYGTERVSAPSQLLVSDSNGACSQYNDARSRAGALPAEIQTLKNKIGPLNNEIGAILDRIRSVPGLGFIIRKMISTNPLLNSKVAERDNLLQQIRDKEAENLRAHATLNDPSILARCQSCQLERETQVADRINARPYGSFLHYVQDMRARALSSGGSATSPSQTAANTTSQVYLTALDDPSGTTLGPWVYMRSVWYYRNQEAPYCS